MYFKMKFTFLFLLLLFEMFSAKKLCPKECICDLEAEKYRRVSCEGRNLLNIINVPEEVNILSFRDNVIIKLEDYCLRSTYTKSGSYMSLMKLDLSENSISDINMHAFRGLEKLEILSLSRNRLEMIYPYFVSDNELLKELDLSYNNFVSLKDEVFLHHRKLKILNLSNTLIVKLYPATFTKLPSLEVLDLSGNNMIALHIDTLRPMSLLQDLSLKDNRWSCNLDFDDVQKWLVQKKINYETQCKDNRKKSEKIIITNPQMDDEKQENDLIKIWNLPNDEQDEYKMKNKSSNKTIVYLEKQESFIDLFNAKFPPLWSLTVGFLLGLLIGIFISYFWIGQVCSCRNFKRRHTAYYNNPARNERRRNLLLNNTQTSSTDTPPILRRQFSNSESAFLRSHSWEMPFPNEPATPTTCLVLENGNEMHYIPRPRMETPPPPYTDCENDNVVIVGNVENDRELVRNNE